MPRTKSAAPAYRFHVSGQARVELGDKTFYLGKHGSPESYARYHALLAEYNANGRTAPGETLSHMNDTAILVKHVTADFRNRELSRQPGGHHNCFDNLLKLLDQKYGDLPADDFGPRKLEDLRDGFVAAGNCRRYANEKVRNLVRIFRHGVARELVAPNTIVALEALKPLRIGQAKDNTPRGAVDLDVVAKTLPHLCDVVADMIRIQLATGARPSELFGMTPAMVDRSGDVWVYRPVQHKNTRHGKTREIPLVGDVVTILSKYMFGGADEPCFATNKGTRWNKDSYRRHVTRACDDNKIPRWTPYQCRHTAAQVVRDALGVEAAQALLGHARVDTTEIYAKASLDRAIEAARAVISV